MSIPTEGETFSQLTEHIRKCEELTAKMGYLRDGRDKVPWLAVSEQFKRMNRIVVQLATKGRLN